MCSHLIHGHTEVVDALLTRDYSASELLAHAAAASGADVTECVALAWERFIGDDVGKASTGGTRGALLGRVVSVLDQRQLLDAAPAPAPEPVAFLAAGDRWAGWWEKDPPEWPLDPGLLRPHVLAAVRAVSLGPRVLLVLRDAAGISPEEAEPIVNVPGSRQNQLLDEARQAYVSAMDGQLTGGRQGTERDAGSGGGREAGGQTPERAEIRARDVSCDVIVGLIGRWLDGDMDDPNRDAYEQHLLFCPPCLVQTGKTRRALTALRETPAASADDGLRRRLTRLTAHET